MQQREKSISRVGGSACPEGRGLPHRGPVVIRALLVVLVAMACLTAAGSAQEALNLATPVSIGTRSTWQVNYLHIDYKASSIAVEVQDNLGNIVSDRHDATTSPTGAALIASLNTANLASSSCGGTPITACSLAARLIKHLQGEGKIAAGSISGTPQ